MQHLNFSSSVLAHNIKTNDDVGVTFHIEPDHSPRVGDKSRAWFALTRKGGNLIPLSECECELKVYLESGRQSNDKPILNPTLIAISPEKYQNIPGADIVFPEPGIYQLELTGKPTQEGDFSPFQVSYPVTVNPGVATPKETINQVESVEPDEQIEKVKTVQQVEQNQSIASNPQQEVSNSNSIYFWLIGILVLGLGATTLLKLFQKN